MMFLRKMLGLPEPEEPQGLFAGAVRDLGIPIPQNAPSADGSLFVDAARTLGLVPQPSLYTLDFQPYPGSLGGISALRLLGSSAAPFGADPSSTDPPYLPASQKDAESSAELAQAPATDGDGGAAPISRRAVPITLPGVGPTHLDAEFADRLSKFEQYARENGVSFNYSSGYRTPEHQDEIRTRGEGTTPARKSLHSAGLAVDIDRFDKLSPRDQKILRDAAARAGLSWGGVFRNPKPDPGHFFFDPRTDRQVLIDNFAKEIQRLGAQPKE